MIGSTTCIYDSAYDAEVLEAYWVTCTRCGEISSQTNWCSVHGGGSQASGGGGVSKHICDEETKEYSTTNCVRGVKEV